MSIPYIYRHSESKVSILGEKENLIALGEMLRLKGKMGVNFSATMKYNNGNTIQILIREDLEENNNE